MAVYDGQNNHSGHPQQNTPTLDPETRFIGRGRVEYYPQLDSTNKRASVLAREGAGDGTLVWADVQTAGRGRYGRNWHSPPGVNLYLSLVLRPGLALALRRAPLLSLCAGLSAAEAVSGMTGLRADLKWPNDLLIHGRKAAGILLEAEMEEGELVFAVLGVGINVNLDRSQIPPDLVDKAGSLLIASGRPWDRLELLSRFLLVFETNYLELREGGWESILERYRRICKTVGREVEAVSGSTSIRGLAEGVDQEGRLLIRSFDSGEVTPVSSGEVTLASGYGKEDHAAKGA